MRATFFLLLLSALSVPSTPGSGQETYSGSFPDPEVGLPDVELEALPDPELEPASDTDPIEGEVAFEWLRAEGYDTVICPFRTRIDYDRGEIECGLIRVPENREVEGSRTIELHFVRINARGKDADGNEVETRSDPVIYLTGGPGVTVEGYVARLKDHGLVEKRDLYILEQRGIGHSGDFCPFFGDRNRADYIREDWDEQQRALFEQAGVCVEGAHAAGVDVTGYHTFENARDIKALRMALGLDEWNVWGISYGSVLGQAYMKVDPDGLRSAVIDAIVPLDLHDLMRIPHWHTRNLEMLFAACAEQDRCGRVYGDLQERYMNAIVAMSEQPMILEVEPEERYPDGRAVFFQDLIAGLPFSLLYEESTHAAIPAIIHGLTRAVERRDERFFRALALADMDGGFGISMGMAIAVRCMDGYVDRWAEASPADFRDYPVLANAFASLAAVSETPELCRAFGLEPRDSAQFELVETDLPVVVANGAWDPITPVPLAEYIMPGFANGQLVIFPHAGHGPTRSLDCAGDFLNAYFDDPTGELDTSCAEDGGEAARYMAPYFRTQAIVRGIVMQHEKPERFRNQMTWGGGSLGLVLLGLLVIFSSWLNRRFNKVRVKGAGGARLVVFLATALALTWLGGLAMAAHATSEITEALLIFGLVPWAMWFAWLGPLALLVSIAGLIQSWRYRERIALGSLLGLWLTCLAVISLNVFGMVWDLWPI